MFGLSWRFWSSLTVVAVSVPMCGEPDKSPDSASEHRSSTSDMEVIPPEDEVYAQYAGSASCKECHERAFKGWQDSNHGLAERGVKLALDRDAFEPKQKLEHLGETTEAFLDAEGVARILTEGYQGEKAKYRVVRVIGNDPLRQFLIEGLGGRLQTCDASYDPHKKEWFNVYATDPRDPGDWGHWTGQGMNWNAMCAACHNTRLRKNYDPQTNSYHTTMAEMTVGCEACHGPMKKHVEWQKNPPTGYVANDREGNQQKGLADPTVRDFTRHQMMDTCAACHSRRTEITGDLVPGEPYFDHFALTVTDGTDLYYPDGQVQDENYVFSSFLSSSMHHAGVTCGDCHEPHSNQLLIQGNMLCMRCHGGGTEPPAPVIVPELHSPCTTGSAGHDCKSCHMPHTTYMQRHPRRDHGFTIPDPLLTKEYGVPNACNRCHTDQSTDWALEEAEKFYGDKLDRPNRRRAILVAEARRGTVEARDGLVNMVKSERIAAWRATACHLLEQWVFETEVTQSLLATLQDESPLVREAAARVLVHPCRQGVEPVRNAMGKLLDDPLRSVRVAAAWSLVDSLDLNTKAGRELLHMLDINADQPTGRMRLSQFAYLRGDANAAVKQIRKAIEWDPNSPPFYHDLAILLNAIGDNSGAIKALRQAISLDDSIAEYQYKLALALAEAGDLKDAISAFEKCVKLDAGYSRAWYNLGLAYHSMGRMEDAIAALKNGEAAGPSDPSIPYARATIHARLGQKQEAAQATMKALQIRPDFPEAMQPLRSLR